MFFGRLSPDFAQPGDMGCGTRFERLTVPSELQRRLSLSPLRLSRVKTTREDLERAKVLRGAVWRVAEAALGHRLQQHRAGVVRLAALLGHERRQALC